MSRSRSTTPNGMRARLAAAAAGVAVLCSSAIAVNAQSVPAERARPADQMGGAVTAVARGEGVVWSVIGPRVVAWTDPAIGEGESEIVGWGRPFTEVPRALSYARGMVIVAADDPFARRPARLRVVDATDPTLPAEIGTLALPGTRTVSGVVSDGSFAWVLGDAGLITIDLKRPTRPNVAHVLRLELPLDVVGRDPERVKDATAGDVAMHHDLMLVARPTGLHVIDAADPLSPRLVSTLEHVGGVDVDMDPSGAFAAVVGADGLTIVSLRNPLAPEAIGSVGRAAVGPFAPTTGPAIEDPLAVGMSAQHVAVLDRGGRRLLVFDLHDPHAPRLIALHALGGSRSSWGGMMWNEDGSNLWAASALGGLTRLRGSAVGAPPGRPTSGMVPTLHHLSALGHGIVAAAGPAGVYQLERVNAPPDGGLRDEGRGWRVAHVTAIQTRQGVTADVQRVAAAPDGRSIQAWTRRNGLVSLALDQATGRPVGDPAWLDEIPGPGTGAAMMHVDATTLYLADAQGIVRIVDISTPQAPRVARTLETIRARAMAAHGDRLLVLETATEAAWLHVLDLSEPRSPRLVATTILSAPYERVAFDGRHAFVLGERGGLAVVDVDATPRPTVVARHPSFPAGAALAIGERLVVLSRKGLEVWDVATPAFPRPRPEDSAPLADGLVGGASGARDLIALEGRLLLAREAAGLYDLPAPFAPPSPAVPPPPRPDRPPEQPATFVRYLPAVYVPAATTRPARKPARPESCDAHVTMLIDASASGLSLAPRIEVIMDALERGLRDPDHPSAMLRSLVRFDRQAAVLAVGMNEQAGRLPAMSTFHGGPRDGARIDLGLIGVRMARALLLESTGSPSDGLETAGRREHVVLVHGRLPDVVADPNRGSRPQTVREADRLRAEGGILHAVVLDESPDLDLSHLYRLTGAADRLHRPSVGSERLTGRALAGTIMADAGRCGP